MPETDQWAEAAAVARLERALSLCLSGGCPVRPVASAFLFQTLAVWALWAVLSTAGDSGTRAGRPSASTRLFTAPSEASVRSVARAALLAQGLPAPPERHGDFPKSAPSLSAIQLDFDDDVGGRLPEVVRQEHGTLALLDKENPDIAHYLFQPPAWEPRNAVVDVSARLRLWMDPPEKWALFRSLAHSYGIALDQFRAGALFDVSYGRCLQDAIGRAAEIRHPGVRARVLEARLRFAVDRPCGIEVVEVTLAKNP